MDGLQSQPRVVARMGFGEYSEEDKKDWQKKSTLKPGESLTIGQFADPWGDSQAQLTWLYHGVSAWTMSPGKYTIRVTGEFTKENMNAFNTGEAWTGKAVTNVVTVTVLHGKKKGGVAQNGLQLVVDTQKGKDGQWQGYILFRSVSDKVLLVDYLAEATIEVVNGKGERIVDVKAPSTHGSSPTGSFERLDAGETWQFSRFHTLAGMLFIEGMDGTRQPLPEGEYTLTAHYKCPKGGSGKGGVKSPACWSGELTSNAIKITVPVQTEFIK